MARNVWSLYLLSRSCCSYIKTCEFPKGMIGAYGRLSKMAINVIILPVPECQSLHHSGEPYPLLLNLGQACDFF